MNFEQNYEITTTHYQQLDMVNLMLKQIVFYETQGELFLQSEDDRNYLENDFKKVSTEMKQVLVDLKNFLNDDNKQVEEEIAIIAIEWMQSADNFKETLVSQMKDYFSNTDLMHIAIRDASKSMADKAMIIEEEGDEKTSRDLLVKSLMALTTTVHYRTVETKLAQMCTKGYKEAN